MLRLAAMSRLSQRPPGNSRFAGFLPDSKDIQRVEIAESPVKCAFRGVCPHPVLRVESKNDSDTTISHS